MAREKFDLHDPVNKRLLVLAQGDVEEARLLRQAIRLARGRTMGAMDVDSLLIPRFRRSLSRSGATRGGAFREAHKLAVDQAKLNIRETAFSGIRDGPREEHAAFCYLMYQGYQQRFIDRHPGEEPEAFLDRARKSAINLTRMVIRVLSQLYRKPPTRTLGDTTSDGVKMALAEIWSDQFNLDLLDVDRYTRLLGTVAVRPFWDPESPGGIRLWAFMSHQLRVIPDTDKPWKPKAVIERHEPFAAATKVVIWTDKSFLLIRENGEAEGLPHGMGRIPLTFFRDYKSYTSFMVEGRGRGLCDQNALINGKLTDISEIEQFQGFAVPIAINPEEDDVTIGPRKVMVFKPGSKDEPFGLQFAQPNAPLRDLRAGIEGDIKNVLMQEQVPPAALGAAIDQRSLSGVAIRHAMQPITDDNAERGRVFTPIEHDLADAALCVKNRHDPGFTYLRESEKPTFAVDWAEPDFPLDTDDQIKEDEFNIAHGINTPAAIMRRKDPTRFKTHEGAVEQWHKNIAEIQTGQLGGLSLPMDGQIDENGQPTAGMPPPIPEGGDPLDLGGVGAEIAHNTDCPTCVTSGRNGSHQGRHTAAGTSGLIEALQRQGQLGS